MRVVDLSLQPWSNSTDTHIGIEERIQLIEEHNKEGSLWMKAQQRDRSTMVETSNDCNGVVVNRAKRSALQERVHAIDSTRGLPKQLVEKRCSGCSSGIHAKSGHESALQG